MSNYTNTGNSEVYEFTHSGKPYAIWAWLNDDNQPIKLCLAEPDGHILSIVRSVDVTPEKVATQGGAKAFFDRVFLPVVNKYLLDNSGTAYPNDDELRDQFNWIISNGIKYENGKVVMI